MLQISYLGASGWRSLHLKEGTSIRVLRFNDKDARPAWFRLWINNRFVAESDEPVMYGSESELPINDPFEVIGMAPERGLLQVAVIPPA